jgi:acyl-CoA thioesterase FadM
MSGGQLALRSTSETGSFAVVRAETEFHHELYAGDVTALESTIIQVGEKSATFHHRLRKAAARSFSSKI